jgi:hypothetical protein
MGGGGNRRHAYLIKRVQRTGRENNTSDHQEDILQRRVLVQLSIASRHDFKQKRVFVSLLPSAQTRGNGFCFSRRKTPTAP